MFYQFPPVPTEEYNHNHKIGVVLYLLYSTDLPGVDMTELQTILKSEGFMIGK